MPPKPSASKQSKSKASNFKQPAAQIDPKWIPLGKNTFNLVEQEWMQREFMARFIALDGKSKAKDKDGEEDEHGGDQEMTDDATPAQGTDKGKRKHDVSAVLPDPKSQADQLRLEMLEEFNKKFYWRNPANPPKPETKALRDALMWSEADWNVLPRRMYNWLQKHKPDDAKAGGSTKSAGKSRSKSKPRLATIAEETEETHGVTDSVRRERMVQDLDHVIRAVSRATGAEMVLYGVWEDGGVVNSMEVASQRAQEFLSDNTGMYARQGFTMHVCRVNGPHLCTNTSNSAPTVYGDPAKDYLPIFPIVGFNELQTMRLLDLWFRCLWRWSSGQGDLPYALMKEDSESETFVLTDPERYPNGVKVFKHPFEMTTNELRRWSAHIIAGQQEIIDLRRTWRFPQPRPGKYETYTRLFMSSEATLNYPPESYAYFQYLQLLMPSDQDEDREDGLPRVASDAPYLLIMPKRLEQLISAVGEDSIYAHLLKALTAHDESWPYEAPKSAYEASKRSMPLLRVDPPLGTDDLDILVQEPGGFISPKFYRQVSTKDRAWRLFSLISWCDPSNWTHDPSGTLMAVVMSPALFPHLPAPKLPGEFKSVEKTAYMRMIALLRGLRAYMQFFQRIQIRGVIPHLNLVRVPARHHYDGGTLLIANPDKLLPESYKEVDIEFLQRDTQEIYIAAESLLAKLLESEELLQSSLGDRTVRVETTGAERLQEFNENDVASVKVHLAPGDGDEWTSDRRVVGAGTSRRRGKARSQRSESGSEEAILSDEESSTPTEPPEETGSGSESEDEIEDSGEEPPADPTTSVRSRPRRTAAAAATKPKLVRLMEIELPPVASKSRSSAGRVTRQSLK
ncbi:hypothetical protein FRC07_003766 [Ceratobasidium sp. 392]|nr:hypothetical protein FRC07_003766 [Ceratobasidium sp. 392]